jgi:hypothetical protein
MNIKTMLRKKLGRIAAVLTLASQCLTAQDLPVEIQADLLLTEAKEHIDKDDWAGAARSLKKLKALNTPLPDEFRFLYGRALYHAYDGKAAQAELAGYMKQAGRAGAHYKEALSLYVKCKNRVPPATTGNATTGNATKENPFKNSLEMKFVPVPGTEALFCIWETRVQDYAVFAKQTDREVEQPYFSQGATHPVMNVSWDDAQAFCKWLTEAERQAGKIPEGARYRLPTDEEWSRAVGLSRESGTTPQARDGGIKGVYPWGNQWPPPREAGNYGGSLNVDSFEKTSPAGSFAANKHGLYDLGGNVWEWCEDWDDADQDARVLRGASWYSLIPDALLSSCRVNYTPSRHLGRFGFRVVLESVSSR